MSRSKVGVLFILFASTLLLSGSSADEQKVDGVDKPEEDEAILEPPFPSVMDIEALTDRIHIVSESYDSTVGIKTTEEYIDLKLLKNVYITKDKRGRSVTFLDVSRNLIYQYSPYNCHPLKVSELNPYDSGLWLSEVEFKNVTGSYARSTIFGISAIWMNAERRPKVYEKTSEVYSTSKDLYRAAHKWTVEDPATNTKASLYFIETQPKDSTGKEAEGVRLELETIQIDSNATNKTLRTLNILTVDNVIPDEVYAELLQVPVGYGCHDNGEDLQVKTLDRMYLRNLLRESYRLQLEVTATKYDTSGQTSKRSSSDTISVELAKTNRVGEDDLQMIRQRDTRRDEKIVYDYFLNVQYSIDLRRGLCEMSNMGDMTDESTKIVLKFENSKLELSMDLVMMDLLFIEEEGFYFIKQVKYPSTSLFFFEKSTTDLFAGKMARIIRVYSAFMDDIVYTSTTRLNKVMIKVFDENQKIVVTSFTININEGVEVTEVSKLARLFDVSEECYLNNERMRSGRDYAWLDVSYSLPNKLIATIDERTESIKEMAYSLLRMRDISIMNAPRMDLILEDDSMTMRLLLLDMPPLTVLYDFRADTTFSLDKSLGDQEDLTQDLGHCADLCRLHKCKVFSFSETTFTCLLSSVYDSTFPVHKFTKSSGFATFIMPQKEGALMEDLFLLSLHSMLASLQHKDYDHKLIPAMPEEMLVPISETGITEKEREKISMEYFNKLAKLVDQIGHKLPILTFIMNFKSTSMALLANKIEIEDDPLEEFKLFDRRALLSGDDDDAFLMPADFHEGLSLHHYKMGALQKLPETEAHSKLFEGLSYDQCTLACVDSKCSSFSYCGQRKECIVTDIWDIGAKMSGNTIERDSDCFIAQRDFVTKFNKFSGVPRPNIYKKTIAGALNPSECAHACIAETDYNCLAFDYCQVNNMENLKPGDSPSQTIQASCFFTDERLLFTGNTDTQAVAGKLKPSGKGCDHYSRSYLADFNRNEYRKFDEPVLYKLKKETLEGYSVDQCADKCVNEYSQCTAFQFCLDPKTSEESRGTFQSCIMIDGSPEDLQLIAKSTTSGNVSELQLDKLFVADDYCHVFSLRSDSNEARLRDLALNWQEVEEKRKRSWSSGGNSGVSIGGALLLFVAMTILSISLTGLLMVGRERSQLVRNKTDQLLALLRR